jgi:hypothetical protein
MIFIPDDLINIELRITVIFSISQTNNILSIFIIIHSLTHLYSLEDSII